MALKRQSNFELDNLHRSVIVAGMIGDMIMNFVSVINFFLPNPCLKPYRCYMVDQRTGVALEPLVIEAENKYEADKKAADLESPNIHIVSVERVW